MTTSECIQFIKVCSPKSSRDQNEIMKWTPLTENKLYTNAYNEEYHVEYESMMQTVLVEYMCYMF